MQMVYEHLKPIKTSDQKGKWGPSSNNVDVCIKLNRNFYKLKCKFGFGNFEGKINKILLKDTNFSKITLVGEMYTKFGTN